MSDKIFWGLDGLRGFLEKVKLSRGTMGFLEEMRKRFLQGLEGARRSRPGGPFEVMNLPNPPPGPKKEIKFKNWLYYKI